MASIDVNKLKVGVTFLDADSGDPHRVLKYDFAKMGRGKANIKIKARNLISGSIVQRSFLSGGRVDGVDLEKKELQYLYSDEKSAYFMDQRSFEQVEVPIEILGEDVQYLVEGENAWVQFWGDKVLGVELAASVVMKITETEPGAKGNSATNVYKPAKTNSGLTIQVPLFIRQGDFVKVNTATGEYVQRVKE
jgi:elongation factor P